MYQPSPLTINRKTEQNKKYFKNIFKGSIQNEDITSVNIYSPNKVAPKYIKQMLTYLKGHTDSNIILVGDKNTPLSTKNKSTRQKSNKKILNLNDTLDQMDLTYIYRTFHPKATEYTFSSSAHGTFSRIDHMLGHKASLNKLNKIETISSIFSDHNSIKLGISYKKRTRKFTNMWRLNNMLLNNQLVRE